MTTLHGLFYTEIGFVVILRVTITIFLKTVFFYLSIIDCFHIVKIQSTVSSRWVTLRPAVVSTARIWSGVSCLLDIPRASGYLTPGFNPPWRSYIYRLAPDALRFKGIPMGPEAFLGIRGASGLRPCARTHLKKGIGLTSLLNDISNIMGYLMPNLCRTAMILFNP